MAEPIATSLAEVLLAVQARLMDSLGWPAERVILDARSDRDHELASSQAEQYVRVQVKNRTPDQASMDARGRIEPFMKASISVVLRTRINLDVAISDESALTEATRGHLPAEHSVWDALIVFQPEDEDGNWLVTEPIRPRMASAPQKPPKEWMQSVIDFDVTFAMDLDQSYQ